MAFTNGPLSHILKNRLYLGEINHKGVSYPSEHEPIIGLEQWEAVQAKLKLNLNRTHLRRANSGALLKGRLFDDRGTLMSPSYTMKKRICYRYYVSSSVAQGRKDEAGTISRLPAEEVEKLVLNAVRGQMSQKLDIGLLSDADLVSCLDVMATVHAKAIEIRWIEPDVSAAHPNDGVSEHRDASNEAEVANIDLLMGVKDFGSERCCIVPYRPQPHKRRREITLPENASGYVQPVRQNEQQNLIRAMANGKAWLQELING